MKRMLLWASIALALLGGCATSKNDPGSSAVTIEIASSDITPMMLNVGGRMGVEMQVEVTNHLGEPITVTSMDVNTVAEGAFYFRSDNRPRSQVIAPHQTAIVRVNGWGYSTGGRIAEDEPITLRGVAHFRRADKTSFNRVFSGILQRR